MSRIFFLHFLLHQHLKIRIDALLIADSEPFSSRRFAAFEMLYSQEGSIGNVQKESICLPYIKL